MDFPYQWIEIFLKVIAGELKDDLSCAFVAGGIS